MQAANKNIQSSNTIMIVKYDNTIIVRTDGGVPLSEKKEIFKTFVSGPSQFNVVVSL